MRAVLDPNVIVSAALSPEGAPAAVLRAARDGAFEAIASLKLLAETERVLAYPKLRRYVDADDAAALLRWLDATLTIVDDPETQPSIPCSDPGDDYLIALAEHTQVVIVSGDKHLLGMANEIPVLTARQFLSLLHEP